ncbi:HAD family hydrolase [Luteolibacter sp. AS25]|uniref:HAD family hydrolase n=1 Tax=Luteolibacter sp. AS25 TaxID=3135776 RepID=UPI00398B794C
MLPKAVLFDFDGILVDTEGAIFEAWKRTFERHGKELSLDLYTKCIGSDFDAWSPKVHLEELTSLQFDWLEMDEARQVEIRAALEEYGPIEGVIDLLEEIQSRGIPMAVVSSSAHPWVDGWLDKLGLRRFFDHVICKGDAPRIKPAPDLYLAGAKVVGMEPEGCLVFEDSLNGLNAAIAAGMKAWIVPNRVTAGLDFSQAAKVLPSFTAARDELFKC